ncbi:hypothetical protein [Enterococcus timonensis]|uniref:hypothetical protein n=1 Tax=Enterococcus timonensis TaxID=1852364 RepID=UPI00131A12F2|nr:hypothetical protein [Enterococcus timonensis]
MNKLTRYGLLIWTVVEGLVMGLFLYFETQRLIVDDARYLTDWKYREFVKEWMAIGEFHLLGNELKVTSPILLFSLLSGLVVFSLLWKKFRLAKIPRSLLLIFPLGIVIPLLPPFESNVLPRLVTGFILCLLVSLILPSFVRTHVGKNRVEKKIEFL